MNTPGFSADYSLYRATNSYRSAAFEDPSTPRSLLSAAGDWRADTPHAGWSFKFPPVPPSHRLPPQGADNWLDRLCSHPYVFDPSTFSCVCSCTGSMTCCSGSSYCVDLQRDRTNCGRCGNKCARDQSCFEGECRYTDNCMCDSSGEPCSDFEICQDGVCRPCGADHKCPDGSCCHCGQDCTPMGGGFGCTKRCGTDTADLTHDCGDPRG